MPLILTPRKSVETREENKSTLIPVTRSATKTNAHALFPQCIDHRSLSLGSLKKGEGEAVYDMLECGDI